jgi:hypothetical protein
MWRFKLPVAMGRLHHNTRWYFVLLAGRPGHSSNGQKMPSVHCYYEFSKVKFPCYFFKKLSATVDNWKRLTVEDKIIPTPIDFNRFGIVLSSNVDSCCFRTVRIFNIISLHFGERGGTKLATLSCNIGSLAIWPGRSSNGRMTMLTRCYSDLSNNSLCDVTGARCYCDQAPLSVT